MSVLLGEEKTKETKGANGQVCSVRLSQGSDELLVLGTDGAGADGTLGVGDNLRP